MQCNYERKIQGYYFINICCKKNVLLLFHKKFQLKYIYPDREYSLAENLTIGENKLPNNTINNVNDL